MEPAQPRKSIDRNRNEVSKKKRIIFFLLRIKKKFSEHQKKNKTRGRQGRKEERKEGFRLWLWLFSFWLFGFWLLWLLAFWLLAFWLLFFDFSVFVAFGFSLDFGFWLLLVLVSLSFWLCWCLVSVSFGFCWLLAFAFSFCRLLAFLALASVGFWLLAFVGLCWLFALSPPPTPLQLFIIFSGGLLSPSKNNAKKP